MLHSVFPELSLVPFNPFLFPLALFVPLRLRSDHFLAGKVYEGDGGPASEAGLDLPNAMAFAPGKSGSNMAIADFGHSAVRVIAPISPCA